MGQGQGWQQPNGGAAGHVDQQAMLFCGPLHQLAAGPVQLHADHQAQAPDGFDARHASHFATQPFEQRMPLACRVGCTVLDIIEREQLLDNAARQGHALLERLRSEVG
ncbi:MAG: aminotransferase class III-fold pyridoxal phosphate-dependent enzyme, partial [Proteobacteria bacterium]